MQGWNVSLYLVKRWQPFDSNMPLVFEAFDRSFAESALPLHG
jgi:hypothetical protein